MKLYIIGNGFDLDLGIKSSYSDFFKSNEFNNLLGSNSSCDFAKHLSKENIKGPDVKWVDIEVELKKYVNNLCIKSPKEFKLEFHSLKNALKLYLKRVNILGIIDQSKASSNLAKKIINDLEISQTRIRIINFNYTSNIVKLVEMYNRKNVSTNLIEMIHVHGKLDDDIILGIEDDALIDQKEGFVYLKKGMSKIYNNNKWRQSYSDSKEIIIFGHSLGESDVDVFMPMFTSLSRSATTSKLIKIFHHPEDEDYMAIRLNKLLKGGITRFKTIHDLQLNPDWNVL